MEHNIKQYMFVIRELTAREIKRKYARSVLGIIWSILHPLLYMVMMTFVFGKLSGGGLTNYRIYFISGYVIWNMFQTASTTSMTAFVDNKSLFQKAKLPREVFVLSRNYTALVNLGLTLIAFFAILVVYRFKLNWTVILIPIDIFFVTLFSIGVSFILATIYVFYKDIKFIWRNIIVILIHMIALYIPIERYPENLHEITRLNPMFFYPNIMRTSVMYGTYDIRELKLMVGWGIFTFIFGVVIFKLYENRIMMEM